ncbi:hypothetical protein BBK82_40090 [Lentzea guizhouensis]|uniref:Uncharacterized protein n=1 Tax=Lentzea guizhouensis TaxID=1586287 RepID=A0A1B2HU91_9PSEU|nr:hypothetical protein [Lentzea guizhouensis]ANZ41255.1 hypothetical protein BBK82_40090 [Lentzea guizhouensis]
MKKLSVSVSAAVVAGLCFAAPAQAGCDPVHDPGTGCSATFQVDLYNVIPGGSALAKGTFVDKTPHVKAPSFVQDTADDGLAAHLWIKYFKIVPGGTQEVTRSLASASGVGTSTPIEWLSPDQMHRFYLKVCVGEGESNCTPWYL